MLGRPYLYGLATGDEAGVDRSLELLRTVIERALALVGCPDVADLDTTFLRERVDTPRVHAHAVR